MLLPDRIKLPLAAVVEIVNEVVPAVVPASVTADGENMHAAPAGRPVQVSCATPLNPVVAFGVRVSVIGWLVCPAVTVAAELAGPKVKF